MQRRNFLLNLLAAPLYTGLAYRALAEEASPSAQTAGAAQVDLEKYRAAAVEKWEEAIAELEQRDKSETHPDDSILFVGSSSVRFWADIAADMAPYHPIQRGYGGAKWSDVAIFADRLIKPHTFRAAVFFVGNDITGGAEDKSPEEIVGLFAHVLGRVREHNEAAPVFYVAVTPTPARFNAWPQIKVANSAVRTFCERSRNVHFIGTESLYLDAARQPRPELFVEDGLHLNRDGYMRWAAAIKSQLDSVLGGAG